MHIGCRYNARPTREPLELTDDRLKYVDSVKYLGLCLISSTYFKCSVDYVKVKFYQIFSGRELTFTFAICYRPSVRLSSVVCLSVTLVHPTQAVELFGAIFFTVH